MATSLLKIRVVWHRVRKNFFHKISILGAMVVEYFVVERNSLSTA